MLKVEQVLRNENGENLLGDFFDNITINSCYILVQKNGLKGLYDAHSFIPILKCEWDKIVWDMYIKAYKDSKIAVFAQNGQQILKCEWDKVVFYDKGVLVTKERKQGFYSYNSKPILNCVWKRIEVYPKVLLAYMGNNAKKIMYTYQGEIKNQ